MSGMYEDDKLRVADVITANSVKVWSVGVGGRLVLATELERRLHAEDQASAKARLAIDKVMRE